MNDSPQRSKAAAGIAVAFGAVLVLGVGLAAGFLAGRWSQPAGDRGRALAGGTRTATKPKEPEVWTCSMHPQIRQPGPGKCPICRMDLIPLAGQGTVGPRRLAVTAAAAKLMDIEVAPVERRFVTATVRMVGKIDYDETRLKDIAAWVPGRLDRLYVDYTGVPVRRGDHMVSLYSPQLLAAQEELLQAIQAVKDLRASDVGIVRQTAEATILAAREKLRLLGLTAAQIGQIEAGGRASDHLTIYAPIGGIVVRKHVQQGAYVRTGTPIYTIADLSRVWVRLDAYESDLEWLRYGQKVEFATVAYPGETFVGTIAFLDPVLDSRTRTVKVRVNAANAKGWLKPGMFVKAVIRAKVAARGRVVDPDLAGKWISPMHPEIVKDAPGKCDVCGMPLVRAEELGYVSADPRTAAEPLVVPASAVLRTGKRAIVYVRTGGADRPVFEGRQITLGPRAGPWYLVRGGLAAGEQVVVRGNFKIDSALQIEGRPSMMLPEGGRPGGGHDHPGGPPRAKPASAPRPPAPAPRPEAFARGLGRLLDGYFAVQQALAADNAAAAQQAAAAMAQALPAVEGSGLSAADGTAWQATAASLTKILLAAGRAEGIEPLRAEFSLLSQEMSVAARRFGTAGRVVYRASCPMAFDNAGASWLQTDRQIANPYFGATMLRCGSIEETLGAPEPPAPKEPDGGHRHQ